MQWEAWVLRRRARAMEETAAAEQAKEEAPAQGPPAARPWILLSALPRIRDELVLKELCLDLAPAPALSSLAVSRGLLRLESSHVLVNPALPGHHFPYIAAVEPSGRALLLCVDNVSELEDDASAHHCPRRYLVWDAAAGTSSGSDLVELVAYGHPGSAGLVRRPSTAAADGAPLTVSFLSPTINEDEAKLCYRTLSAGSDWVTEMLLCERPNNDKPWRNDGTFALDGHLWWVDLSSGLIGCNVLAPIKELRHIPFPPQCYNNQTAGDLDRTRCVRQ